MALFQSGTYNLAPVAHDARFHWGVAMLPAGPKGRVSVTNGIAAAGNSASKHPDAVRQVLAWMGSTEGNAYLGRAGAAIPAVLQRSPSTSTTGPPRASTSHRSSPCWTARASRPPAVAGFAAGNDALQSYFDEMFLGRGDVATTLNRLRRRPTPRLDVDHSPVTARLISSANSSGHSTGVKCPAPSTVFSWTSVKYSPSRSDHSRGNSGSCSGQSTDVGAPIR